MEKFDNNLSCLSWLRYLLEKCEAEVFFTEDDLQMEETLTKLNIMDFMLIFGAEIQLTGKKGVDISTQYPLHLFDNQNPLMDKDEAIAAAGEFLKWYANKLKNYNPMLTNYCDVYLEADTSKGKVEKVSYFVNLRGGAAFDLYADILRRKGLDSRVEVVGNIMLAVKDYLELWHLGFMDSRTDNPLRIAFRCKEVYNTESLIAGAECITGIYLTEEMKEKIRQLGELKLLDFFLDIDVMPDGSIGDTVGIEIIIREKLCYKQREIMRGNAYKNFVEWLKKENMADERIDKIYDCIWGRWATNNQPFPYYIYSSISHFKLRWQKGKAMPAKVYMKLEPCPVQFSINESIAACSERGSIRGL